MSELIFQGDVYYFAQRSLPPDDQPRCRYLSAIAQKKRALTIYQNSGAFWYADFDKLRHPDYKPELPSEDEAIKIATDYLKRNEWLPEGAILGSHTNTEGSIPPSGSRFAFWISWRIFPWMDAFDMQTAWKLASLECFDGYTIKGHARKSKASQRL